jgi:predicted permease
MMSAARAFFARLGGFLNRARRDRELAEELESHLQAEIDDNLRAGMTPGDARRAALVSSGGLDVAREAVRDRRGLPAVETLARDVRHAVRLLRRHPAFSLVAVLLMALGIGANTAIFTLVDQVMLRPLPVKDPGQLVMLWTTGPHLGNNQGNRASSYPLYQDVQREARVFSYVFCRYDTPVSVSAGSQAERVMGELVSGNYFQALGIGAAVGRVFTPEEDDRVYKGHPVVVLSHQYWVTRFGADPSVVGRTVLVNSYPMVIVGVSAAGFSGTDPARSPQIRIPVQMKPLLTPGSDRLGDRRTQWIKVFARLAPGQTMTSAQAELQPLLSRILRSELGDPAVRDATPYMRERFLARQVRLASASHGYSELRESYGTVLSALMAMVGLVLLIACFNVASLLIARAATRQREVAMRLAIGASRRQLTRQLVIESGVLTVAGGAAGLVLSVVIVRGLLSCLPVNGMLLAVHAAPDWRVLGFNVGLACVTALFFGLASAWPILHVSFGTILKDAGGVVAGRGGSTRLRRGLVAGQVAFSFLVLAGAGLLARTAANLSSANPGFRDIDRLMSFQVDPARNGYDLERSKGFYRELQRQFRSIPGVTAAGYAWIPVLSGRESDWDVVVEGRSYTDRDDRQAFVNWLSPGYWQTMGLKIADGRDFNEQDEGTRFRVAIVNRAFAAKFLGQERPVGRHIGIDTRPGAVPDIEIVGLVEDTLNEGPRQGVRPQFFLPIMQSRSPNGATFYVRTANGSPATISALRNTMRRLDAAMPMYSVKTLGEQLDETLGAERLAATLSTAFGVLATLLVAVGLYGVTALAVARRTREIGLRMALGATKGAVLWMVMKDALGLLVVGLAVGFPCAWWLSRYVSSLVFGVVPTDAWTAAIATMTLATVTVLASGLPAWRASTMSPSLALRQEWRG